MSAVAVVILLVILKAVNQHQIKLMTLVAAVTVTTVANVIVVVRAIVTAVAVTVVVLTAVTVTSVRCLFGRLAFMLRLVRRLKTMYLAKSK